MAWKGIVHVVVIPKHLGDLYQSSKRSQGKMVETNFTNNLDDLTIGGISVNGPNESNESFINSLGSKGISINGPNEPNETPMGLVEN